MTGLSRLFLSTTLTGGLSPCEAMNPRRAVSKAMARTGAALSLQRQEQAFFDRLRQKDFIFLWEIVRGIGKKYYLCTVNNKTQGDMGVGLVLTDKKKGN